MINPNQPAFNQGGRVYNGTMVSAPQFFTDAATTLNVWSSLSTSNAATIGTKISGGEAGTTLLSASTLTPTEIATVQNLLGAAGLTPTQIGGIDLQTAQATLSAAAPVFAGKSAAMAANATATADKDVDAEQTGTGYTPIIGANFTFGEKLNVGLRYEFRTKLTLKNKTKVDGTGMFPDDAEFRSDIPAILSIGIGYKITPQLRISAGGHYYFDEDAKIESGPGSEKKIDGNLYEIALGGEYDITDKILISAGYLYTKTGVGTGYQTDLSHSLTSSTVGFGGAFKATEKMTVNLGMLYTMYTSDAKDIDYSAYGIPTAKETYNRTNLGFAIGVDYHF